MKSAGIRAVTDAGLRTTLLDEINRHHGNLNRVAKKLRVSLRTLYYHINRLGLKAQVKKARIRGTKRTNQTKKKTEARKEKIRRILEAEGIPVPWKNMPPTVEETQRRATKARKIHRAKRREILAWRERL